MVKRFSFFVSALFLALPLSAEVVTKKFDWRPVAGVQDVSVEVNKVVVSSIRFDLGDTVEPLRYSSAKAVARVDNNSWVSQEVGVAIAIFDQDGNMIAAGNGGVKVGYLPAGERETFTVRFPYVYRHLDRAKTFLVTLETKERPSKKRRGESPKPTATPASN